MRKYIIITFSFVLLLIITGCTTTTNDTNTPNGNGREQVALTSDQSIAFSTYLASGLLEPTNAKDIATSFTTMSKTQFPTFLSATTTEPANQVLEIEDELSEITVYFDYLKVLLDKGIDSAIQIQETNSSREEYETEINYSINGEQYTLFYNREDRGRLTGILLYNGMTFDLVGADEVDDDEHEIKFKTIDQQNPNNWIIVEIEIEDEHDEYSHEIELKMDINDVYKEVKIEFSSEDDELEVELEIKEGNHISKYELEKDRNKNTYSFEYEIDDVEGEVTITVITDQQGNQTYRFDIDEGGYHKEVDRRRDDDDDDDDDDNDDDNDDLDD